MTTTAVARKISGMGAIPHDAGVAFRVWAPHADAVSVVGTFNHWDAAAHPLEAEGNGYWYTNVESARIGGEYKYSVTNGERTFQRIDPYAREVTHSSGTGLIHDPGFDWGKDHYELPSWNEFVVYEMHVGTFGRSRRETGEDNSDFNAVEKLFDHLEHLGVNILQLMPTAEFAGDISWGYNPAHIFAVESAYGGPVELKEFVRNAHRRGFGVILDVVYNHFGPSDIDLWQFDGWSENDKGGIYFYNDWRAETPWGSTRPDYGRGEVRQFIFDNAMMWLDEYRIDGLRFDMTLFMRSVAGNGEMDLPDGWGLMQWINKEISDQHPGHITLAEDLQNDPGLTRAVDAGGAGFSSQWDAAFVHPIRQMLIESRDEHRSMEMVRKALTHQYNHSAFERVVYTESHDEVANGKARVPTEIHPDDPESWFAQKRSTLGAVLTLTAPGIPMLFQGQEFLQGDWFDDQVPLDWHQAKEFSGIVKLYRDLIHLRRNSQSETRGLTGQHINVHHLNEKDKLIAYHRWSEGGPGDDVLVIANFANRKWESYDVGAPRPGKWTLRLNSDWRGYSRSFGSLPAHDVIAPPIPKHGQPATATISIGPYSALIFSQGSHD
jgi:1,4-alpha-glucan branching enzyme